MKRLLIAAGIIGAAIAMMACTATPPGKGEVITMMLDWVPNTNHTGLYVAQEKGYFRDEGLEVSIVQPGEVFAEQAVASGAADFGISFQEQVTLARAQTPAAPLVSIAAIIQHNTSGFATLAEKNIENAGQFNGLKYGSFGTPFEEPTLRVLMSCDGGDYSTLQIVNTGASDPLALIATKQIDLAWIFYGWQGIQAKQQGIDLNVYMMADHTDCIPDYYTPVLITSEAMIAEKPDVVRAFLKAVSRGYTDAINNPDEAADLLLKAVPDMDATLVKESQAWLSPRYQADAARWGEQSLAVWVGYSEWMAHNAIIDEPIDAEAAFTNEFLP